MRHIIIKILLLIISLNSFGQGVNLVPLDSAYYEFIKDSLINRYQNIPDSLKNKPDDYKYCPCIIDSLNGIVSYHSNSFLIRLNQCLFLFKKDNRYFVRVGQMTSKRDNGGKNIWRFSIKPIDEKTAIKYIRMVKNEIAKAEVPRYNSLYIVMDGNRFTFGDLEQHKFATTPIVDYSKTVIKAIKFSQKIIRKKM